MKRRPARLISNVTALALLLALALPTESDRAAAASKRARRWAKLEITVQADKQLGSWLAREIRRRQLRRCGRAGDSARLTLRLQNNGRVDLVRIETKRKTKRDAALGRCLGRRLRRLRLPKGYQGTIRAQLRWRRPPRAKRRR
jgi:hypothetical protein